MGASSSSPEREKKEKAGEGCPFNGQTALSSFFFSFLSLAGEPSREPRCFALLFPRADGGTHRQISSSWTRHVVSVASRSVSICM